MKSELRPIDTDTLVAVPWKNGGGTTRNLAVTPKDAGFEDFLWRVSIADVKQSGRFSLFPGVDRTMVLLEGSGMVLDADDGTQFALTTPFRPYSFRGEAGIEARLVNGPARDFNVMVRRGGAGAVVECWQEDARLSRAVDEAVFYCARGMFQLSLDDRHAGVRLSSGFALRVSGIGAGARFIPQTSGGVLLAALIDLSGGA